MTAGNLPAPLLIIEHPQLKQMAEALRRQRILGVDTESNSLFAYYEQVCLMQFSTPEADVLIDPLAVSDVSALAPLFSDAEIEKVFHAAEYDLICLRRDFGFEFANLFDTMAAARILGYEAVGLGSMLEAQFGVHVDKRQQRANWGQRPLPPDLLDYARMDTHYLIPLRNMLKEALQTRGLWPLAVEDFRRLAAIQAVEENGEAGGDVKEVDCWRISGAYDLPPHQAAVLLELCRYRDRIARAINRPLFKVINDRTLLHIAAETPQDLESLSELPGMTPVQVNRHGAQLVQAVKRGLKSRPLYPRRSPRPDERYLQRVEALRQWRKVTAQHMGMPSDVVLPRDLLYDLARRGPCNETELAEVLRDVPWRLEQFGGQILKVI